MQRKLLINIHMFVASFILPLLCLTVFTGTGYLLGFKGSATRTLVGSIDSKGELLTTEAIESHVRKFYPEHNFEYVKKSSSQFFTRPTTQDYYLYQNMGNKHLIFKVKPNLMGRLIESHKGHGPKLYKWLQVLMGILVFILIISGFILGLKFVNKRVMLISSFSIGTILTFVLLFFF